MRMLIHPANDLVILIIKLASILRTCRDRFYQRVWIKHTPIQWYGHVSFQATSGGQPLTGSLIFRDHLAKMRGWFERNPLPRLTIIKWTSAKQLSCARTQIIFHNISVEENVVELETMWASVKRQLYISLLLCPRCLFALCANFARSKRLKATFQTNSMQSKLL